MRYKDARTSKTSEWNGTSVREPLSHKSQTGNHEIRISSQNTPRSFNLFVPQEANQNAGL